MTRKPISITAASNGCLYAICDDGTIWMRPFAFEGWLQIASIPQPEDAPRA